MSDPILSNCYVSTADVLKARILALIPANPAILGIESAWDLLDVPGFKCNDLDPSLAQVSWALSAARHQWRAMQATPGHDE